MNPKNKREVAQWRMSILGPLVSARLHHGELTALLQAAAAHPSRTTG